MNEKEEMSDEEMAEWIESLTVVDDKDYPKIDSHWNYRVIRKTWKIDGEIEHRYGIHEVYYSDGKPSMCTVDAMDPHGETIDELKCDLKYFLTALTKPVLDYHKDFGHEESDTDATTTSDTHD